MNFFTCTENGREGGSCGWKLWESVWMEIICNNRIKYEKFIKKTLGVTHAQHHFKNKILTKTVSHDDHKYNSIHIHFYTLRMLKNGALFSIMNIYSQNEYSFLW